MHFFFPIGHAGTASLELNRTLVRLSARLSELVHERRIGRERPQIMADPLPYNRVAMFVDVRWVPKEHLPGIR